MVDVETMAGHASYVLNPNYVIHRYKSFIHRPVILPRHVAHSLWIGIFFGDVINVHPKFFRESKMRIVKSTTTYMYRKYPWSPYMRPPKLPCPLPAQ